MKVTYNYRDVAENIVAVKALYTLPRKYSLKQAKEWFELGVLFITGMEWDAIESAFPSATVTRARKDEERAHIRDRLMALSRERDGIRHRMGEITVEDDMLRARDALLAMHE